MSRLSSGLEDVEVFFSSLCREARDEGCEVERWPVLSFFMDVQGCGTAG